MRVLYLSQWKVDAEYGGGQVYLRNLLRAMATQEIEAGALVVVNGQDERQEEMLFERVRVIQRGAGPAAPVDTAIEEEIRRFGADVVHAHGWKREAARVCKRLGVPCVVTMHHGGLVCPARVPAMCVESNSRLAIVVVGTALLAVSVACGCGQSGPTSADGALPDARRNGLFVD
jgi:hypothetical protein